MDNYQQKKEDSPFIVVISDGYCKWEYGLKPSNEDNVSIQNLVDALCDEFGAKIIYSKRLDDAPYNKHRTQTQ
jgi:hypothetical protein